MNIAIVDDNKADVAVIEELLGKCLKNEKYSVYEYFTTEQFVNAMHTEKFDIVLLDIILDEKNGIEVGELLNKEQPDANVIFVSRNPDYFKDVYKVNHSYFLTKEFEKERFFDAVNKAVESCKRKTLLIETKTGVYKISINDILYMESVLKHTKICFINSEIKEYNVSLKSLEKLLPSDFVRVHQSFIVNMKYIESYDSQIVKVSGNYEIPMSRTYTKEAREKITCYLGGII